MEIIENALKNDIIKMEIGEELSADKKSITGNVELDIENQTVFMDAVNAIFEKGINKIIVDLSNISYIDSSGLWAIFEGFKKAQQKEGMLILLSPAKDVKRVLDITKMSSKLKICTDLKEAQNMLEELNQ